MTTPASHQTPPRNGTVIITAATVVIFGNILNQADVLVEGATRLLGK